ncbi:MAG: class I SAM-dependent methyltransferase [Pseudomonadales bacterium]
MDKLYDDLAAWWPLLSPVADYAEEAALYCRWLLGAGVPRGGRVLELGSGGGNNAFFMKAEFALTLVEPAPGMQAHSRTINPDCEHLPGDMRTLRLERQFDGVFVHDAVAYMTTEADLCSAMRTAFVHTRPGGAALFVPDYLTENFKPATDHGGSDGADGRGLRYLEWMHDPDPTDSTYTVDYALLLKDANGDVRIEHDRHVEGLFPRAQWLRWLSEAGFSVEVLPLQLDGIEPGAHEAFLCRRPSVPERDEGADHQ